MVSVIIPANNEQKYLNRTIENIFNTAQDYIEVVVVLNGYKQDVDPRAKVIQLEDNMGERVAMNRAAETANGDYFLRIDAHCDFSPGGWDVLMANSCGKRKIVAAVLTAINKEKADKGNWERVPGHWYGLCRMVKSVDARDRIGLEAKWEKPNAKREYDTLIPTMAITGCGFMVHRDFYREIGGADESLPPMGAIGEEFALKAWLLGEGVWTRTDVMIGHIFGTGGYDTGRVEDARHELYKQWGDRYGELAKHFPEMDTGVILRSAAQIQEKRTVIVSRVDEHITRDRNGEVVMKRVEHFKYIWIDDGSGLTEKEVEKKYAPLAKKVGEETWIRDHRGELVQVA